MDQQKNDTAVSETQTDNLQTFTEEKPKRLNAVWDHIKRRLVPLGMLAAASALVFGVILLGTNRYIVTDGVTSEEVSLFEQEPENARERSSFGTDEFFVSSVTKDEEGVCTVFVKPKYNVNITADGKTTSHLVGDCQVAYIVRQAGIELGKNDFTTPSLDTLVISPMGIRVTRVTTEEKVQKEAIPFTTEETKSAELYIGESRVKQEGVEGLKENVVEYTYHDGIEVSNRIVSSKVINEPVKKIVESGTKMNTSTNNTAAVNASRVLKMQATAYSGTGKTASGKQAGVGLVAVDPKVIPLGTKLWIEGYGYATAADTGGSIKGNRIDLYFRSEAECKSFGRKTLKVYVLS